MDFKQFLRNLNINVSNSFNLEPYCSVTPAQEYWIQLLKFVFPD